MSATPREAASEVMDVVPLVMRTIRKLMRRPHTTDLSVPQFRTLSFLNRTGRCSLTDVAEHLGLALPSASTLIDGLVERKLVIRAFDPADRRRVVLGLTSRGHSIILTAIRTTQSQLSELLADLTPAERVTIVQAMQLLSLLFASEREKELTETKLSSSQL